MNRGDATGRPLFIHAALPTGGRQIKCFARRNIGASGGRRSEKFVEKMVQVLNRQLGQVADLVPDPDAKHGVPHDRFHGGSPVVSGGTQPCLSDCKCQDGVSSDAWTLGDLHECILAKCVQQHPAIRVIGPSVECPAAHPESLEGVPDTAQIPVDRRSEAPVDDIRGDDCTDETPDIVPKRFATRKDRFLREHCRRFGIEPIKCGTAGLVGSITVSSRKIFELQPEVLELLITDGTPAGRGKTNGLGQFPGVEAAPGRWAPVEKLPDDGLGGRAGQARQQRDHSHFPEFGKREN